MESDRRLGQAARVTAAALDGGRFGTEALGHKQTAEVSLCEECSLWTRRLNAIRARLSGLDWTRAPTFDINGLKREELIAASSVILHEIYFESLGGQGDSPPTGREEPPVELARALERDFGSVAAWRAEFTAVAKALVGGSGWAILAWSARLGRLVNQWGADHAHGLPAATPILAIDMYEHAYHLDFGANATAYVDQVMANLNWERIGARYQSAVGEKSAENKLFLP